MQFVLNLSIGGIFFCHTNFGRVIQKTMSKLTDFIRESRRKQQVLTLFRQDFQNTFDVVDKAHVQHAVGFIENQNIEFVELNGVLAVQVEQTPRRCDQYFSTAA